MTEGLPAGGDRTIPLPTGSYNVTDPPALAMPPGGIGLQQLAAEPPDFPFAF